MGQAIGSPITRDGVIRFNNLPKEALESLWTSYNLLGEGWGLNLDDIQCIFQGAPYLVNTVGITATEVETLFNVLDTDTNGLIDALEMMTIIALLSGMDSIDKIFFVFSAYDFSGTGSLSVDETNLLLRSVASAANKVCPSQAHFLSPSNQQVSNYAALIFQSISANQPTKGNVVQCERVSALQFQKYCCSHPVMSSWVNFFASVSAAEDGLDSINKGELLTRAFTARNKRNQLVGVITASSCDSFTRKLQVSRAKNLTAQSQLAPCGQPSAVTSAGESSVKGGSVIGSTSGGNKEGAAAEQDAQSMRSKKSTGDNKSVKSGGSQGAAAVEATGDEAAAVVVEVAAAPVGPPDLPWFKTAALLKPEEMPVIRQDPPQDTFEPCCVHGISSSTVSHCCAYVGKASADTTNANDLIVYPVSRHLVTVKRPVGEDGQPVTQAPVLWQQQIISEHMYPITSMAVSDSGGLLVTADSVIIAAQECPIIDGSLPNLMNNTAASENCARIIIWSTNNSNQQVEMLHSIPIPRSLSPGVRKMDISANEKYLLVLLQEPNDSITRGLKQPVIPLNTTIVYDLTTYETVYYAALGCTPSPLTDAIFAGSSSIIATASMEGMAFHIDEGAAYMGNAGYKVYEQREALYQVIGKTVRKESFTALSRFEQLEEVLAGTAHGHLVLWRGRCCTQVVHLHAATAAVTRIVYNSASKTVATSGRDGKIMLLRLQSANSNSPSGGVSLQKVLPMKKGPRFAPMRLLEVVAMIDVCKHDVAAFALQDIYFSRDASRILVASLSGELLELSAVVVPTSAAAAPAGDDSSAGEGGDGDGKPALKLGDDVNGGPIVKSHAVINNNGEYNWSISGVAKTAGGFISAGADGVLRLWCTAEGQAQRIVKSAKIDAGITKLTTSSANPILAVALDGSINPARDGLIQIFATPELTMAFELKQCANMKINDLSISSDGNMLAVACCSSSGEDGVVFIFTTKDPGNNSNWVLKVKITCAKGMVPLRIDFSSCGLYLRVQTSQATLVIYDANSTVSLEVSTPAVLKVLQWSSHSCLYHWDTFGVFNFAGSNGNESSPMDTSIFTTSDRFNNLFVTGGSTGCLTITRVPAPAYRPPRQITPSSTILDQEIAAQQAGALVSIAAHVGPVASCVFIEEGAKLVTCGLTDGVIMVWRGVYDADEPDLPPDTSGDDAENAAEEPAAEEEVEEGSPPAVVYYDSGEEEDLFDLDKMKAHLTPSQALVDQDGVELEQVVASSNSAVKDDLLAGVTAWCRGVGLDKSQLRFANAEQSNRVPCDELKASWVMGYNSRSSRHSVKYNQLGHIVYPAASMGIIFDKVAHKQTISMPHNDLMSCLDVHSVTGLAASGHIGTGEVYVVIWHATTGAVLQRLSCGPVSGLSAIAFSPCGAFVAVACQDFNHSVLVFHWASGQLRSASVTGPNKILDVTFSLAPSNKTMRSLRILETGVAHFGLLDVRYGRRPSVRPGYYGSGVKKHDILCATAVPLVFSGEGSPADGAGGPEFIVGLRNGSLGVISRLERKISNMVPVHVGPITAICCVRIKDSSSADEPPLYKLVTAGVNGLMKVLDGEMQPIAEYNLYTIPRDPELNKAQCHDLHPLGKVKGFRSVCVDKLNRKILYGTSGGEIGEIEMDTGLNVNAGPIVQSHFRDELFGLAVHAIRQECVTVSDDKTLRIWNIEANLMVTKIDLPDISRAVTYSPNGQLIVCGLGGQVQGANRAVPRAMNGRVVILSYLQGILRIVHIADNAKDAISSVVFSPDGSRLFAASLDCSIYCYDALDNFKMFAKFSDHTQPIRSLDMSLDGRFLISHGFTSEILVWDCMLMALLPDEGESQLSLSTRANTLSQMKWFVRQSPFGVNSLGAFPTNGDSANNIVTLAQSRDDKLLVVGDAYGALRLYRNPADALNSPHRTYLGHSNGGISKVCFSVKDKFLITMGKHDRTVVVWNVLKSIDVPDMSPSYGLIDSVGNKNVGSMKSTNDKEDGGLGDYNSSFIIKSVDFTPPLLPPVADAQTKWTATLCNVIGVNGSGAVGGFNNCNALNTAAPQAMYCGRGDIISTVGTEAFVLCKDRKTQLTLSTYDQSMVKTTNNAQRSGDVHDISCVSVSSCGRYIAVGTCSRGPGNCGVSTQSSRYGRLTIVNASHYDLLAVLSDYVPGGVQAVCFSKTDSRKCFALCGDLQHSLLVFGTGVSAGCQLWTESTLLHKVLNSVAMTDVMSALHVSPASNSSASYELVTAGSGTIKFWSFHGHNVSSSMGQFIGGGGNATTALVGLQNEVFPASAQITVSGHANGELWLWRGITRHGLTSMGKHVTGDRITCLRAFAPKNAAASSSLPLVDISKEADLRGLVSSSSDGVRLWHVRIDLINQNEYCQCMQELSIANILCGLKQELYADIKADSATKSSVTCLSCDAACDRLLIGVNCGQVVEAALDSGALQLVMQGDNRRATHWITLSEVLPIVSVNNADVTPPDTQPVIKLSKSRRVLSQTIVTANNAKQLTAWSLELRAVLGTATLAHNVTSLAVISVTESEAGESVVCVAVGHDGSDTGGQCGSIVFMDIAVNNSAIEGSEGSIVFTVVDRIHNLGKGAVRDIKLSPSKAVLAVCSDDGMVYLYDMANPGYASLGCLRTYAAGIPVVAADFSVCSRYLRAFGKSEAGNKRVEVCYYDFQDHEAEQQTAGSKINKPGAAVPLYCDKMFNPEYLTPLRSVKWSSTSSAGAPLAHRAYTAVMDLVTFTAAGAGVADSAPVQIVSMSLSADRKQLAVGYSDGMVRVFECAEEGAVAGVRAESVSQLTGHACGPVRVLFLTDSQSESNNNSISNSNITYKLVTMSEVDSCTMLWSIASSC